MLSVLCLLLLAEAEQRDFLRRLFQDVEVRIVPLLLAADQPVAELLHRLVASALNALQVLEVDLGLPGHGRPPRVPVGAVRVRRRRRQGRVVGRRRFRRRRLRL